MTESDQPTDPLPEGEDGAEPSPARRPRQRRSWVARHQYLTAGIAIVAIAGGLGIGLHIATFYSTSSNTGHRLIHQFDRHATKAAKSPTPQNCPPPSDSVSGPQALVEAPEIGLTAPVEAGTDDAVLNVAVGKVAGSVWPEQLGTTLLAAHDVSYFSGIDQLKTGDVIRFASACDTYVYKVSAEQVVETGTPVYTTAGHPLLVLETCYPLNALFITSHRYLVTATLTKIVAKVSHLPTALANPSAPTVPAPAALAAEGLTLDANPVQLGQLVLAGSPSDTWREGPEPLADEAAALADYFGGLRSAQQDQPTWWAALAPGIPFAGVAPLVGAHFTYQGSLTPTLTAVGSDFVGGTITITMSISGGSAPGTYALTMTEQVDNGQLEITSWSMQAS